MYIFSCPLQGKRNLDLDFQFQINGKCIYLSCCVCKCTIIYEKAEEKKSQYLCLLMKARQNRQFDELKSEGFG
uniref:Uncharacterized protein n=1 Tax=Manihot esculenta TaxID=3983 RepID=A0A2C9VHN4_MANES